MCHLSQQAVRFVPANSTMKRQCDVDLKIKKKITILSKITSKFKIIDLKIVCPKDKIICQNEPKG